MARGALFVACLGIAVLCAMDAAVKELGATVPLAQVVFLRYGAAALFLVPLILGSRGAWPVRRNLPRHALRAAVMAATAFLFFHAITNLPLAVATALSMTAPLYVSLFGALFLREPITPAIASALLVGLAGSLVVVFAGGTAIEGAGEASAVDWIAALLAPVTYALGIVMLKSLAVDEAPSAVIFAQSAFGALLALPLALPVLVSPSAGEWGLAMLAGALGAGGYLLLVAALRHLPASVFALADYTALLWAAGLGFMLFAERPGWNLWAGGVLIMAACTLALRAAGRVEISRRDARPSSARERRSSSES